MIIYPLPLYFGKFSDATGATAAMLARAAGLKGPVHSGCATGRPFAVIAPPARPDLWLTPWVEPLAGLIDGLRLAGGQPEVLPLPAVDDVHDGFWLTVTGWLEQGPVAFGPLDRLRLWNQPEDRFHRNDGCFVVILHGSRDGGFVAHDPDGCPMRFLRVADLVAAALPVRGTAAVRVVATATPPASVTTILRHGLNVRGVAATCAGRDGATFAQLAERAGRRLRAGERAALCLGLAARGLNLACVAGLLAPAGLNGALDDHRRTCADALDALRRDDTPGLAVSMSTFASHELAMDAILEQALFLLSRGDQT